MFLLLLLTAQSILKWTFFIPRLLMWQTEEEEGGFPYTLPGGGRTIERSAKKKAGGSFRGMSTQLEPKRLFWDFVRFFLLLKPIWRDGTVGSNSNIIFFIRIYGNLTFGSVIF